VDPFVGSWESEYDTDGHLDTFEIRADLSGVGKYWSVLADTECSVQITAQHGPSPGNYVGLLNFGPPCSATTPTLTFDCTLANGATRLECGQDKSYRRVGPMGTSGAGGAPSGSGASGSGGSAATTSGAGGATGAGTGGTGTGGGTGDPFVGSWESDYVTAGQHDKFDIAGDLTGDGTYYSIVPGVACAVDIKAMHGLMADTYVGTLQFGAPCDVAMPMSAFQCTLTSATARLACGGDKNFHRLR
jgi:hypothetical protein